MNAKKPTIAITGANGFVGRALTEYFLDQKWHVVGLVRNPSAGTNPKAEYRKYDITKPLPVGSLDGVDYVVHAAYIKLGNQAPDALEINVTGAKRLLAACKDQNVRKALFLSSMSAHDQATSVYGQQKLAIEQLFEGAEGVCLRSGLILGHGGIVEDMAKFMRTKHIVPVIDGGKQPLQTIAIYDLCHVIEAALVKDIRGTLTVATPQIYTYKEFYSVLAKSLRTKVIFVPIPYYALLAAFKVATALHLPLDVGEDNLKGLKQLRSTETSADLRRLSISLDDLRLTLQKINTSEE